MKEKIMQKQKKNEERDKRKEKVKVSELQGLIKMVEKEI